MLRLLRTPGNEEEWIAFTRQLLRAHMTLAGFRFADLSRALARIGVDESEVNLRNRIGRGRFSAVLMLQCLRAMDVDHLMLPTDEPARG